MQSSDQYARQLATQLTELLTSMARSMKKLRAAMAENRVAFVAIDARSVEAGFRNLEDEKNALADLEARRSEVVTALKERLGIDTEVRISRLAEYFPASITRPLQSAARLVDEAARGIRAETNAGMRLLRISRDVNEDTLRSIHGLGNDGSESYDSNAQRIGSTPGRGRLVIGTA